VLTRPFDAPRRLVYAAWTTPRLLRRWYGAHGWRLVDCEVDLRAGGAWRFVSEGPGGQRMGQSGVYREVAPPDRLVFTEVFDEQSYPGETLITHEFRERAGVTTLTSTVRFATPAGRDTVLGYPMARGVGEGFDRLAALFEEELMNWTLEVVVVPVSDVDASRAFYADQLGFAVDHDTRIDDGMRVVQLTPPGSGCSIVIGEGVVPAMEPGSLKGLQLVVPDLEAARAQLLERGVEAGEIQIVGQSPTPQPHPLDNVGFLFFRDPDGNGWAVQQISSRA